LVKNVRDKYPLHGARNGELKPREEAIMATYIMLSTLTDEGRKTLKARPDRLQEVNKEVESMGARVTAQFAVMGGYDFVNIIEAPTNEVMARLTVELGSRGTIQITTLPAIDIGDFVEMLGGMSKD
jgi:uncharacterized protein with GYD domain